MQSILRVQVPGNPVHQHLQGHLVAAAFGYDQVSLALGRLHKLFVHGFHRGKILVDHAVQRAAAALYVPKNAPKNSHVGVRVHKHLDVQLVAQLRYGEQQNASTITTGAGSMRMVRSLRL